MPALSHFYHLRPCDLEDLTQAEAREYIAQYIDHLKDQRRG
ncbi:MAG: hypothetical protein ACRD2W_18405 [Acidimicrobiales bacterium]